MKYCFFVIILFFVNDVLGQSAVHPPLGSLSNRQDVTAVLGAFEAEVNILKAQVQQQKIVTIQGIQFVEGLLNGRKVVVAQTGIGKVNAAITTSLVLDHFHPGEVIFTGIAGGVNPELLPGDIVIGTVVAHHDYGTISADSMIIRPTRDPSSMVDNPIYFKSDSMLVLLAGTLITSVPLEPMIRQNSSVRPKIIKGIIVTGDVFVSSAIATQQLRLRTHADVTEMEGAAVAQACWQQHVPFIVIRSLSDTAGDKAYDDVKKFYAIAAKNSASLVLAMLGALILK